jgi:hypothetical protein
MSAIELSIKKNFGTARGVSIINFWRFIDECMGPDLGLDHTYELSQVINLGSINLDAFYFIRHAGCYGVFALRGEGIRENLRTWLRALFFFLCEVFFSLFSISFFFVLYVSKKESGNSTGTFLDSDLAFCWRARSVEVLPA